VSVRQLNTSGQSAPGSTLFAVAVQERILRFAGDTTNSKAVLLDDRPKAWWYRYLAVPEYTARMAEPQRLGTFDPHTVLARF
jgi:hypothetical protein